MKTSYRLCQIMLALLVSMILVATYGRFSQPDASLATLWREVAHDLAIVLLVAWMVRSIGREVRGPR